MNTQPKRDANKTRDLSKYIAIIRQLAEQKQKAAEQKEAPAIKQG